MGISDYSTTDSENTTVPGTPPIELGEGIGKDAMSQTLRRAIQRIMADLKTANGTFAGADGEDGTIAGVRYTFSNSTSMANPGAGYIRFNDVSASTTIIAINEGTAASGNPDISAWINNSWANGGQIIVTEIGAEQNFAVFEIDNVTDNTGWFSIAVTHSTSNGTITNDAAVGVSYLQKYNPVGDLGSYVDDAQEAEEGAIAAKILAEEAKEASEAARDAASAAAATDGVFTDTTIAAAITAGLAAVGEGETFYATGDDVDYIALFKDVSGVATELPARLFKTSYLDAVSFSESDDWASAVADANGYVSEGVRPDGSAVPEATPTPTYLTGGTFDYDINHLFIYGQSLSVGQATPAISTVQNYDNVMFSQGMRPEDDYPSGSAATWYAEFVPAVEALSPTNSSLAETPAMGAGDAIKERIFVNHGLDDTEISYQIALSTPGKGGQTLASLDTGSGPYNRMIDHATYGLSLATAADKTYAVQAVGFIQGESDYVSGTTRAAWESLASAFITDMNTDFKAETGQTKDIPLIMGQCNAHLVYSVTTPTIALAQADLEAANALAYIACPMYHFEYQGAANVHLTNVSSRWMGAYIGLAYERIVIQGLDWKPLKPVSSVKSGNLAHVTFNVPSGRLVIDIESVVEQDNYGFDLVDSGGSPLTIDSVIITGPTTVKIVAASTIPAGAVLRYGWTGDGGIGRYTGPRGNLRDDQGDTIVFDPNGVNRPMHNWCIISEWSL